MNIFGPEKIARIALCIQKICIPSEDFFRINYRKAKEKYAKYIWCHFFGLFSTPIVHKKGTSNLSPQKLHYLGVFPK